MYPPPPSYTHTTTEITLLVNNSHLGYVTHPSPNTSPQPSHPLRRGFGTHVDGDDQQNDGSGGLRYLGALVDGEEPEALHRPAHQVEGAAVPDGAKAVDQREADQRWHQNVAQRHLQRMVGSSNNKNEIFCKVQTL